MTASTTKNWVTATKAIVAEAAGPPAVTLSAGNLRAAYGGRVLDLGDAVLAVDDGVHHDEHPRADDAP